jgi:hypothetical protein
VEELKIISNHQQETTSPFHGCSMTEVHIIFRLLAGELHVAGNSMIGVIIGCIQHQESREHTSQPNEHLEQLAINGKVSCTAAGQTSNETATTTQKNLDRQASL